MQGSRQQQGESAPAWPRQEESRAEAPARANAAGLAGWLGRFGRLVAGVLLSAVGLFTFLALFGAALRPPLSQQVQVHSLSAVEQAREARDTSFDASDPEHLPRIQRPVDYRAGSKAAWWPKGQSPLLSRLEAAGKLPPVAQRVGPEPLVLDGGSVGSYGGTWLRVASSEWDVFMFEFRFGYAGLFRWSPLGRPIVPHLATKVDASPDSRQFVVHLRRGVRWSDGHPFTADDILFWWEYDEINTAVGDGQPPPWLIAGNGSTTLEKIDDHTIVFRFDEPFGNFLETLAANSWFMLRYPKHYFERYHPETADPAFLKSELEALGMTSAYNLWRNRLGRHDNPEVPRLWPWVLRTYKSGLPYVFVRNPYYFAVDPEGNQLPYIDRVQFEERNQQMLPLAFANGEVTMQGRHISFDSYTELMSRQAEGGFVVKHWYNAARSSWLIQPSLNRYVDPRRPATAQKAKLLADKRFRQALSLAIDRKAIIGAYYDGVVEAGQVEPGPGSPFENEKLRHAFIEHDPSRANQLLDELGLSGRGADGLRTFVDGSPLTLDLMFCAFPGVGPAELVVDDWRAVGLRVVARELSRKLFTIKKDAGDFDLAVWPSAGDFFPLLEPGSFAPGDHFNVNAPAWGRWFERGGFFGAPRALQADTGPAFPPPPGHPMLDSYRALVEARQESQVVDQVARFEEALDIAAENLWTINVAEAPPFLVVVDRDLRNVPDKALGAATVRTPANTGIETYYFEHPSHAADAETLKEIETLTPMARRQPADAQPPSAGARDLGWLLRICSYGILAAFALLIAVRHPFVLRRILLLLPTLLVMSALVFVAIQLPPGDFISSRVLQLAQGGDLNALEQIEELRRLFHFDEPHLQQYARWMGLAWFQTFDPADAGLLQGQMGRSMETGRSVNEIVGDRVLLTVAISAGTILLTWIIALPIGIYSAVRRQSFGDYFLSLVGLIGMSVPPFLLALVLMVAAGVSGLFSPDFAAQPSWDWAKAKDLLSHIWVPIAVMGLAGTAGMARVMRANLLDELNKPYVTTARARGVRPLKLLLKYPVRVALNPFVSTMGQLFPQLISGGAIVAIVLSLPTVGPLQVHALLTEDMYLAGSMLMVLSLLAVLGTLVADLLLLWLDPRIRFDRGAR